MSPRPLTATYRLQFTRDFTFADARRLVPYLRDLGVSHLYASPIFEARPGSSHGYDVVDHDAINPELGGEAGLKALVDALHAAGLGLVADIVPNHAGVGGTTNARWLDVLELGRRSRNARFFDIDWSAGPLVLPILEAPLDEVVASGKLRLVADRAEGRFQLVYADHRLPVRPQTVARILAALAARLGRSDIAAASETWAELETVRAAASGRRERREALATLMADPAVAGALDAVLAAEDPAAVAAEQHYRPMLWREGAAAINYRRFFDITDLACLRVEEPAVFDAVHRLPLALVREGRFDGLRVDHIDGLADPAAYAARLRERVGPDVTIHLEKILEADEPLRPWPVDGTTGYETLNLVNALFVDPDGYRRLSGHLAALGINGPVEARIEAAKREVLERSFSAEVDVLTRLGTDLSRRSGHPVRLGTMREIIVALIAALPVYRTYVTEESSEEDRRVLAIAAARARPRLTRGAKRALVTLVELITGGMRDPDGAAFIRRFQQLSGPAMAKGYEDTELYRSVALASVNEVGGSLIRPFVSIDRFHAVCAETAARGLHSLTPLSTHDTKRGADTRARLNVLSEISDAWLEAVRGWCERHRPLLRAGPGGDAPDPADENLLYQTIAGVWPIDAERLSAYLVKALREAKRHSSWIDPDLAYEAAVASFAEKLVEGEEGAAFRTELAALLETLAPAGRRNALSQTVLQLTIPGVPDIYQGSEFFEHVLVDPDNRRPVDWTARIEALAQRGNLSLDEDETGVLKQRVIAAVLGLRRADPELFSHGRYEPLPLAGGSDILAFARRIDGRQALVAVETRALADRRGDIILDLGTSTPSRWERVVGTGDVRQEGRLVRLDRAGLPAVVYARSHD